MSSPLNFFNDSSKSEEFNFKDIEVFVEYEEQNCFKMTHVRKFLGLEDIGTSLNGRIKKSQGK